MIASHSSISHSLSSSLNYPIAILSSCSTTLLLLTLLFLLFQPSLLKKNPETSLKASLPKLTQ
jgi:hypothetical protein